MLCRRRDLALTKDFYSCNFKPKKEKEEKEKKRRGGEKQEEEKDKEEERGGRRGEEKELEEEEGEEEEELSFVCLETRSTTEQILLFQTQLSWSERKSQELAL